MLDKESPQAVELRDMLKRLIKEWDVRTRLGLHPDAMPGILETIEGEIKDVRWELALVV